MSGRQIRMTSKTAELERLAFAEKAAAHFKEHPEHWSYTDGDIEPGAFFALRWGGGGNCVLVLKLDDFDEPVNYQELIR